MDGNELLDRWIAALRSGEYEQGQGQLRDGDKYCCLGVLCDVSEAGKWSEAGRFWVTLSYGADTTSPWQVWVRVARHLGEMSQGTLMHMNDEAGFSFYRIADEIDRARARARA